MREQRVKLSRGNDVAEAIGGEGLALGECVLLWAKKKLVPQVIHEMMTNEELLQWARRARREAVKVGSMWRRLSRRPSHHYMVGCSTSAPISEPEVHLKN